MNNTHSMLKPSVYDILGAKLERWRYVQEGNGMVLSLLFDNGNSLVITNPQYEFIGKDE